MKKKTILIDIDGCLNMYPAPLQLWAEVVSGLDNKSAKESIKKQNDFDYLKETYRHSTVLNYLLPRDGASETISYFKKTGYHIVLLSARNPAKNPEIKKTTEKWLEKYSIQFDLLLFTKEKNKYIQQHLGEILLVIEDEPQILETFDNLKTEIVVFKNELNDHLEHPHFHVVYSWKEIASLFEQLTATQ